MLVEEKTVQDPAVEETTQQVESTPDESAQKSEEPPKAEEPPQYTPNFKYKASGEEKEIPELFRPLIKDKQTEDTVRSLFCKADGIEDVKSRHEKLKKDHSEVSTKAAEYERKTSELESKWNRFNHLVSTDKEAFLQAVGFTDNELFEIARRRLQLHEQGPEERKMYDDARQAKIQAYDLQETNKSISQQLQEMQLRQHESELRYAMSNPEIEEFKKDFDSRMGEGAFLDEVKNYGVTSWVSAKKHVTPMEAVQTVVNRYKPLISINTTIPQQTSQPKTTTPPVIPNVGAGRGTSPVVAKINSIEDVVKLRKQFEDQQSYD